MAGQLFAAEVLSVAVKLKTESTLSNKFLVFKLIFARFSYMAVEAMHGSSAYGKS